MILKKSKKLRSKKTTRKLAKRTFQKKKTFQKREQKSKKKKTIVKKPTRKKTIKKSEEERKTSLRKFLISMREKFIKDAKEEISKYIKGESRQLVDTALDDGDWSIIDLSEDINLKKLSSHRETLLKIDEALRKLEEGTYGICEDCGEEISEERLKVLPFAIYCIDCQEKQEKLEKIKEEFIL